MGRYAALALLFITGASATPRYYFAYMPMGTGDNHIATLHQHGGAKDANHKWNVECLDGEAAVGIRDQQDDYQRLDTVWCKYTFPYKSSSQGTYPYYSCIVRNYYNESFCFSPRDARRSINTFVTAVWDDEFAFAIARVGGSLTVADDSANYYKCCKTPKGYYIDYVSCYYAATRDQYLEYYDSYFVTIVVCGTGYVITGMTKKINPTTMDYNLDWIQCCRVGYGAPTAVSPPIINGPNNIPTFYAAPRSTEPESNVHSESPGGFSTNVTAVSRDSKRDSKLSGFHGFRFQEEPMPYHLAERAHDPQGGAHALQDGRHAMLRMSS